MRSPDWLRNSPFAHRGLHGRETNAPENSIAAFQAAMARGYGIELDVQMTADGKLVVFHDADLFRMTTYRGAVADLPYDHLTQLRLDDGEHVIPLLQDVLDLVADSVPILIEVKNEAAPGDVEQELVRLLSAYGGRVALQAFNPRVVRWFASHLPHVPRGQLAGSLSNTVLPRWKRLLLSSLLVCVYSRPSFVNYELTGLSRLKRSTIRYGLGAQLLLWTIRTCEDLRQAMAFDGNIVFEDCLPPTSVEREK